MRLSCPVRCVDDGDLVAGQSIVIQALVPQLDSGTLGSYEIVPTPAASVRSASAGQGAKK